MTTYNCTPHTIVVRRDVIVSVRNPGTDLVIQPSGWVVRLETEQIRAGETDDCVPIVRTRTLKVTGWPPEAVSGDIVIVSSMVAQTAAAKEQAFTVVAPDTGPTAIREDGQVVAVRGFQIF
jgi:hypothetical protein